MLVRISTDRAFHFEIDEALEFHRVFHWELADEVVDETIDGQGHGLSFVEAALLHVEKHVFGDL